MVKIRVSHKFLKRIVELDIPENLLIKAEKATLLQFIKFLKCILPNVTIRAKKFKPKV